MKHSKNILIIIFLFSITATVVLFSPNEASAASWCYDWKDSSGWDHNKCFQGESESKCNVARQADGKSTPSKVCFESSELPKPRLPQPGFEIYDPISPLPGGGVTIDTTDPGSYFARMFAIFIGVASVIAVIMLVLCGFQYMTSDAISSKESAKKRCWAAILGLGLILISWLILNTINPNLLKLPFAGLQDTLKKGVINPETGDSTSGGIVNQPWCYVSSNGTTISLADEVSCNTSRDAKIASLNKQIADKKEQRDRQNADVSCHAPGPKNSCPVGSFCGWKYTGPGALDRVDVKAGSVFSTCNTVIWPPLRKALVDTLVTKIATLESKKASISSCVSNPTC